MVGVIILTSYVGDINTMQHDPANVVLRDIKGVLRDILGAAPIRGEGESERFGNSQPKVKLSVPRGPAGVDPSVRMDSSHRGVGFEEAAPGEWL